MSDDEKQARVVDEVELGKVEQKGVERPAEVQNIAVSQGGQAAGLQYLAGVDRLFVKQKVQLLEAITNFETNNQYTCMNENGQVVFRAEEDTGCMARQCFGHHRGFEIGISDTSDTTILTLRRDLACTVAVCICCLQDMTVYYGPEAKEEFGSIRQKAGCFKPYLEVSRANSNSREPDLVITGPVFTCQCLHDDIPFTVTRDGKEVGKIQKKLSSSSKEFFTDADTFKITFEEDGGLSPEEKALLLCATLLIDYMYFEDNSLQDVYGSGGWF